MIRGKGIKHIASIISPYNRGEKILLDVLRNLKQEKKTNPLPVLFNALKQLAPGLKVLPQIRAGRTIFLSASLTEKSSRYYAMRWCLNTDNVNLKTPLHQRLTADLLDSFQKTGHAYAFKKELNQSVINSRVNAKPVYRGKPKNLRKLIKKRRRKLRFKFRRLRIFRTRIKKRRRKLRIKLIRKRKKKSSLTYLTDHISPSIKARVRAKKYNIYPQIRRRSKKPYKKYYSKKPYKKYYSKKRRPKFKVKKKVKVKLSKKLFQEKISNIMRIVGNFKHISKGVKKTKKSTVKQLKKKVIKNKQNTKDNNKISLNIRKKAKTENPKLKPDNQSVIRKHKKQINDKP